MSELEEALFYFDKQNHPKFIEYKTTINTDGGDYILINEIKLKIKNLKQPIKLKIDYNNMKTLMTTDYNFSDKTYETLMEIHESSINDFQGYMKEENEIFF